MSFDIIGADCWPQMLWWCHYDRVRCITGGYSPLSPHWLQHAVLLQVVMSRSVAIFEAFIFREFRESTANPRKLTSWKIIINVEETRFSRYYVFTCPFYCWSSIFKKKRSIQFCSLLSFSFCLIVLLSVIVMLGSVVLLLKLVFKNFKGAISWHRHSQLLELNMTCVVLWYWVPIEMLYKYNTAREWSTNMRSR